jgi:chorismate mutase
MTARVRAIRGATTIDADTPDAIRKGTQDLVATLLERNGLEPDDLVSVIFTTTPDITAAFPATAARDLGLDDVPLLGCQEIAVPGALELCVRVLVTCYTERSQREVVHVYLQGARTLRADLVD